MTTPESTLTRCFCGDPMFVKKAAKREDSYLACHHCERPCTAGVEGKCPRCIQLDKWLPDVDGPGYNHFEGRKGGPA